ncbi:alpha/beta fold hydrolase [Rhodobacteraceae bacterium]|nr:alpha/beta fold hydrolase [Paracoccaceae bacterium]
MDWAHDHATWPLTQHSRFVLCKPHKWHVQDLGTGPLLLLIHGAGGATHSWQHLIPYLVKAHRVIAIDLPGQGFSQLGAQRRCGLDAMAEDLTALCQAEDLHPKAIIGHSAGAAIALRMSELRPVEHVIGINAALGNFDGVAGVLFPVLAKTIAALPMTASFFSATASQGNAVARIIKGTGSTLPAADIALYRRLIASRDHVHSTLQMMAQWQLDPLLARLAQITTPTTLIASAMDKAVPSATSRKAACNLPNANVVMCPKLGHLAHEEDAQAISTHVLDALSIMGA